MDLAGLRTQNQLAGARSAGDLGLNTKMGIKANQAQGLKGLQESQTGLGQWGLGQAGGLDQFGLAKAGGLDQWDMTQAQMDMQAAASSAAAGAARSRDRVNLNNGLLNTVINRNNMVLKVLAICIRPISEHHKTTQV